MDGMTSLRQIAVSGIPGRRGLPPNLFAIPQATLLRHTGAPSALLAVIRVG
jgi:hypothetical protein